MIRPPPRSTLFPYPALFRSAGVVGGISGAVFKGSGVGILLVFVLACAALWFTIFVACGYGVTTPVVVLEELGSSFDAFGRSWELTRDFKLKVLGLAVVAFLLCNILPSQVLQGIANVVMKTAPVAGSRLPRGPGGPPPVPAPRGPGPPSPTGFGPRAGRGAARLLGVVQRAGG